MYAYGIVSTVVSLAAMASGAHFALYPPKRYGVPAASPQKGPDQVSEKPADEFGELAGAKAACALEKAAAREGESESSGRGTGRAAESPRRRASDLRWGWFGLFALVQLALGVAAAAGQTDTGPVHFAGLSAVLAIGGLLALVRERMAAWVRARTRPLVVQVVLLVPTALFTALAIELPSNHDVLAMNPAAAALEVVLVLAALLALFFAFRRSGAAPAVLSFALAVLGLAEFYVTTFKGMPISPSDVASLSTAAAVAGTGFSYAIDGWCSLGLLFLALAWILESFVSALRPTRERRRADGRGRTRAAMDVGAALLLVAGLACQYFFLDYSSIGISIYAWRPLLSYQSQGFLPSFITSAQMMHPRKPKGYTANAAKEQVASAAKEFDADGTVTDGVPGGASAQRAAASAQFQQQKPSVVFVMNETFSDLSIYQDLHAGYQGPTYFNSISDAVMRGTLYVSAFGGGTCNSEWEFLTGDSMAFIGSGTYPYTVYNLQPSENLARQFKSMGYHTTAMHPNAATNWNRQNVYRDFGFDEFLTLPDFQGASTLRGLVDDRSTYNKILEKLKGSDQPQFITDITMQNHAGYDTGLIPADKKVSYKPDGQENPELDEYLSLVNQSDEELKEFIAELRNLNRPVVVIFFGDHQPGFPGTFNDEYFKNEDEATHTMRLWQTKYLVWANYDIAGTEQVSTKTDTSTNYLGAMALNLIGAPLTDYQKARLSLREKLPAINMTGYIDRQGTAHLASDDAAADLRGTLQSMQYLEMFGSGQPIYSLERQAQASVDLTFKADGQ